MKISNVVVSDNRMGFLLEDASCAYANALRRSIVSLVPTLATEDVEFFANNSALYDETIAYILKQMVHAQFMQKTSSVKILP